MNVPIPSTKIVSGEKSRKTLNFFRLFVTLKLKIPPLPILHPTRRLWRLALDACDALTFGRPILTTDRRHWPRLQRTRDNGDTSRLRPTIPDLENTFIKSKSTLGNHFSSVSSRLFPRARGRLAGRRSAMRISLWRWNFKTRPRPQLSVSRPRPSSLDHVMGDIQWNLA